MLVMLSAATLYGGQPARASEVTMTTVCRVSMNWHGTGELRDKVRTGEVLHMQRPQDRLG